MSGFPAENPSTLGLSDDMGRSDGLLCALGSVNRRVSGLSQSTLVLQAQAGGSAAAMQLAPGHPIVTLRKAAIPGQTHVEKPDLRSQLAVIDSLLDNFGG